MDNDKIITVSPGKQYVRGDTPNERRKTARDLADSSLRKQKELNARHRLEGAETYSPEKEEEYNQADKKTGMLIRGYSEEVDKGGYKKGGMVCKAGGGMVTAKGQGMARSKSTKVC
jgi:hypothetical protein